MPTDGRRSQNESKNSPPAPDYSAHQDTSHKRQRRVTSPPLHLRLYALKNNPASPKTTIETNITHMEKDYKLYTNK